MGVTARVSKRPPIPNFGLPNFGLGRQTPQLLARPTTRKEPRSRVTPFASESDPCPVLLMISTTVYRDDSKREWPRRGGFDVGSASGSPAVRGAD